MNEVFINKVREIILDNFQDHNFNVQKLVVIIGFSKSHVFRKVKASTGKSVNQLIKEIRLSESVKLIKSGEYTCAEVAYKVGFNNPQYFNKCFHDFYGYTPGDCQNMEDANIPIVQSTSSYNKGRKVKIGLLVVSFIFIIFLGYRFVVYQLITNDDNGIHSIAVLPFDDFSMESDTEWFCGGFKDDILAHLSKIKGLRVISRTSTNKYKDSDKTIPEIAKELGVDYLVEGSIRKHGDTILVMTQLINANDTHLWGDSYNEKFEDVLRVSSEVSKKIVEELNVTISFEEEKELGENPTENLEAYKLLSKGSSIADNRTKEDLEKSIEFIIQAITIDPNYAEAYAEIAYSYLIMSDYSYMNSEEAKEKIMYFTQKALEIEPNTTRVYSTLASIYCREGNFKKSKENFEKAIALNPNDAISHYLFADYFKKKPIFDAENWLVQVRKAQKLDPTSMPINNDMVRALLQNGEINEAEAHFNKMKFLFNSVQQIDILSSLNSIKKKDWTEKMHVLEKAVGDEPANVILRLNLALAYQNINHDYAKMQVHLKKIYDTNPKEVSSVCWYFYSLLCNNKFLDAKEFLNNSNVQSIISDEMKATLLAEYHYFTNEFNSALEYNEKIRSNKNYYFKKASIYAKMGDMKRTYKVLRDVPEHEYKAVVFANLKEKDSMYHYLNKMTHFTRIENVNGAPEFDSYRNEPRFQAFLKKNYLPIF